MRDSRYPRGTCLAPGMRPRATSSLSRTSTSAIGPLPLASDMAARTSLGSTSAIWLLIWRMNSAPEVLTLKSPQRWSGFGYFRKYSVGLGPRSACSLDCAHQSERDASMLRRGAPSLDPLSVMNLRGGYDTVSIGPGRPRRHRVKTPCADPPCSRRC